MLQSTCKYNACTIRVQVTNPRSLVKNDSSSAATDKQQAGRHLLAAKYKYLQRSWNKDAGQVLTSFIKLEGVDSIGHVSFTGWCTHDR